MQRTGSILIVDDNPTTAELLVKIVADAGYAALMASDNPCMFWIMINYAPAPPLLDTRLPDMDGPELIAQLRGAGVAATPIVLVSTVSQDIEEWVPEACTGLAKPFDADHAESRAGRNVCARCLLRRLATGEQLSDWRKCAAVADRHGTSAGD